MGVNFSQKMLTSLTAVALALPGIAVAREDVSKNNSNNVADESPFGEITADFKYGRFKEDKASSRYLQAFTSPQGYKVDVWQGLILIPYKRFEFSVGFQRDGQSGASQQFVHPYQIPNTLLEGRSGATIIDNRTEVSFAGDYNFSDSKYGATLYYSSENDYDTRAISARGQWNFNKNNTILLTSAGLSHEKSSPSPDPARSARRFSGTKTVQKYYVSLKQDLSKYNYIQISCHFRHDHGYLSDTYKFTSFYGDAVAAGVVTPEHRILYLPDSFLRPRGFDYPAGVDLATENRPGSRSIWTPMIRFVSYIPSTEGSIHFDYRYSSSSWDVRSHTFTLSYYQPLGENWEIAPLARYYSQSRAKFYAPAFNVTGGPSPFPAVPITGTNYSSDYRLGGFGTLGFETRVTYKVNSKIAVGVLGGYYRRDASYKLGSSDPVTFPNEQKRGAKYGTLDVRLKL